MPEKIRWGILSTAKIGRKVIPSIGAAANSEIVAVASRSLDKARAFADELLIPRAYGSYEELLAAPDIDAVYIPLPNSQHAEWGIAAASAGKHALIEKPFASNANEAQQVVDAFATRGLLTAEAFMYRFHPQTERVKALVDAGTIGKVQVISGSFTFRIASETNIRLNSDLAGGGLMDVGCYPLSLMRLITGEEPTKVAAFANFGADSGVDEMLSAILHFPSGVLAHFDCGIRVIRTNTYEIRGTEGRILTSEAFTMNSTTSTTIRYWQGQDSHIDPIMETIPAVNHYTLMAHDFADAILNKRPPRYPSSDAVAQMRAIDRILAAARAAG